MMYTAQAIYLSYDPRPLRILYAADCAPNPDAIYAHMFNAGVFVNVVDVRPYGSMSGPSFDCYHDEHSKRMCEHFVAEKSGVADRANAQLQSKAEKAAAMPDVERPGAAVEILRRVGESLGLEPGRTWTVASSSGSGTYDVTVRPDTVNGGQYLFCTCPSWPTMRGRGRDCKHVAGVLSNLANRQPSHPDDYTCSDPDCALC